ncbi:sensor histidine kinase [Capnocytophaga cynodegmi]|nr:sensor histidine kinase [Capnocytophaga cynodegmi]
MFKYFKILILAVVTLSFSMLKAQRVERLRQAVNEASSNREKFYILMELANILSETDTTQALKTLREEAFQLAEGEPYLEGIYYFNKAGIYFDYDHQKSQKLYQKANDYLKWYTTEEAYRYRARLWHNYGVLEQYNDREYNLLNITLEYCIPFAEKSGDSDLLMGYFTDVGMILGNNKEYDRALEYYQKSLDQAQKEDKENEALLWTYLNMFDVYLEKKDKEYMSDLYNKTVSLWRQYPKSKLTGFVYLNEARYLATIGKTEEALESIDIGLKFTSKNNIPWDQNSLEYEKVRILKMLNRFDEAKQITQKLLKTSINKTIKKNQIRLIYDLANLEARLGNHNNAYDLMIKHDILKDSLMEENRKKMFADMEMQYRTAEKEKAIIQLENKNKLNQILLYGGISLFGVITAWVLYAWNVNRKRTKKDFLLRKQQQEIEITHALMEGEQQERNRLARELHDGLGGRITGIKMNVEILSQNYEKKEELQKIVKQLDIAIVELRNTAHNLDPSALQKYGLQTAISDFCQSLQNEKHNIKIYTNGLSDLQDKKWQLSVYRIVQELLTNAVKHSQASEIQLQATFKDNLLLIEVEDNGKGFDPKSISRNMGLNNIEARVNYLGGKMEIYSEEGIGTTINIECKI